MQATIISDTSCIILLYKIGQLGLLQKLFGQVTTTQIIAEEFGKQLPKWISIQNPNNSNIHLLLSSALDKGEASAISLALEMKGCLLIIDELKGRKLATQLGITITGTLGVLAQARLNNYIPALKPLLEQIEQTNFRLSEPLVQEVLKQVGE